MAEGASTYLILGAGKFGQGVARALAARGTTVVAVDRDADQLAELESVAAKTVQLDARTEGALAALVTNVDVAIVSLGDDVEGSLLVVTALKEAGVPTVVAKALTESHGKLLTRVGADRIVFPERDMGAKLASTLVSPTVLDHVEVGPGYAILEVLAPALFQGKSLVEANIRAAFGVTVIAIKPGGGDARATLVAPPANTVIREGDILVAVGTDDDVERFRSLT